MTIKLECQEKFDESCHTEDEVLIMYSSRFSERLNELLFEKNLEEMAKKLNVALSSIYYWKSGEKEITLSNLVAVADYLEVSIDYLIGRSDDDRKVTSESRTSFGKSLRKVMKEKNISTYYLRKNYKYGSKHFENWDKGAEPQLSTLVELSNILDCTVDYLVGRE